MPLIYNNCPGLYNYCQSGMDSIACTTDADCTTGKNTCNELGLCTMCTTATEATDCPTGLNVCNESGLCTMDAANWYCDRAACTPWTNMYEEMNKAIPDGYNKCSPDKTCDYELTGMCVQTPCATYADCNSQLCDTTTTSTNPIDPLQVYNCGLCTDVSQCPVADKGERPYVCMNTGACVQEVRTGLTVWAIVGIVLGSIVFVGIVGAYVYFCLVKKHKQDKEILAQALTQNER